MKSFNEQMAAITTIHELTDDAMTAIWQAQCDYVVAMMIECRNPDNWSDSTIDWLPDSINLASSFYCEAHEGPSITLEHLRVHCSQLSTFDMCPFTILGMLFDTYDEMTAYGNATYHMTTHDAWDPAHPHTVDLNALPTD